MKKIITSTVVAMLAMASVAVANPSKHTANYIKSVADDSVGKKVSVDVTHIKVMERPTNDKYGFALANTWDTRNRQMGGQIIIVEDREKLAQLVKKFGVSPDIERARRIGNGDIDTSRLYGILKANDDGKGVFIDATEGEVPADLLEQMKKEMAGKTSDVKKPAVPVKKPVGPAKKALIKKKIKGKK
ncbi:MAG: hypothetical protein AAF226_02940 [Verrucomicrobiota bacterium]